MLYFFSHDLTYKYVFASSKLVQALGQVFSCVYSSGEQHKLEPLSKFFC